MHGLDSLSVERPTSLEGAVDLLSDGGRPLAGGTDLLVRLHKGEERPRRLVYVGRIPELTAISISSDVAEIGAAVTHGMLLRSPLASRIPILKQALSTIGGPAIRAMGTLGGNLANASPAADGLIPLYLLEAQIRTVGPAGERTIPVEAFVRGPGVTDLGVGELIRSILIPMPKDHPLSYFRKVGRRRALYIAVASLGALLWVEDARISEARLALGSVAPTVVRPKSVEQAMVGRPLEPDAMSELTQQVAQASQPIDDLRAPAGYRRQVIGSLLEDMAETLTAALAS